jgi:hypothetical protein
MTKLPRRVVPLLLFALAVPACRPTAPAKSGTPMPPLKASGWTNGTPPRNLAGRVVVLQVFATW